MWGQPPSAVRPGTARLSAMLLAIAIISITLAAMSPIATFAQKPTSVKVTEDLPPGPMQAKATTSCLECHEARIILQQRLSKGAWAKEVDKMVKWGAVVDANDRDALIDYLSTNFSPDRPPYEPPRTWIGKTAEKASASSAAGKSK
ncbi:Sulfite:cytochrome c oxidoreductase subunit B (modular protein) [Candidatus Sulfotelmatobacter kueseliae]|uniref:Sulfite:cytochrome c oxidoreductase subunit B (Modular protein) n=1 Tax=Candidatus Sulfotelmatobacter kueseliae TaxID=2042962 RepID=A0A2U3KXI3_9BACT|nr:Sulfite:cytochrome c oxidoreductase subunit B (modular protein) [Candidatus Sulfotelmatobacter kueseliae]